MAKEYTVELGGKTRRLRYTQGDSRALYRQFQKPIQELFWDDVMGVRGGKVGQAMNPDVQFAVLQVALKNDVPALNEQTLDEWLTKYLAAGGSWAALATECMRAACVAGIVNGRVFDFDEMVDGILEDLGKAPQTPPEEPESAA